MLNRTYILTQEVVNRVDMLALRLGLRQSDLVNFLLAEALSQAESGALAVPIRPKVFAIDASQAA